jgi:hypothetical protein
MVFNLNRFAFSSVNENTPYEVIRAWIRSCGKEISLEMVREKREDIISFLLSYQYLLPSRYEEYQKEDLNKLACFVSESKCVWNKISLFTAFEHIKDFNNYDLDDNFSAGHKTNDKIYNYDIMMLYNYCTRHDIELNKYDNIEDIKEKIKNYKFRLTYNDRREREEREEREKELRLREEREEREKELRLREEREEREKELRLREEREEREKEHIKELDNLIIPTDLDKNTCYDIIVYHLNDCSEKELNDMVRCLKNKDKPENKTINEIKSSINVNYMIARSFLTQTEALLYGAKFLQIDLSDCEDPRRELMELNRCRIDDISYTPLGNDLFCRNYKDNRFYYYMEHFWRQNISELYPQKTLSMLIKNEGMKSDCGKNELEESICIKNFYQGYIPGSNVDKTFIYNTPREDIEHKHVISFGVMRENKFILLTPKEIYKHFKNHRRFCDFKDVGDNLNSIALNKLIAICKQYNNDDDYLNLTDMINELKKTKVVEEDKLEIFKSKYLFASDQIDRVFEEIFYLSMYIRGWKIGDTLDYPLAADDCLDFSAHERKIEINVRNSIDKFYSCIGRIADKQIRDMFYSLPLYKYNRKQGTFYENTNKDEGITICEKINIIKEETDNVYSCLRLSSNALAISAYYYIYTLSGRKLFSLEKLEFIQ